MRIFVLICPLFAAHISEVRVLHAPRPRFLCWGYSPAATTWVRMCVLFAFIKTNAFYFVPLRFVPFADIATSIRTCYNDVITASPWCCTCTNHWRFCYAIRVAGKMMTVTPCVIAKTCGAVTLQTHESFRRPLSTEYAIPNAARQWDRGCSRPPRRDRPYILSTCDKTLGKRVL